jgi:hypothetical protein
MAKCSFSIELAGDAETIIKQAENAIRGGGGDFQGNSNSGNFHLSTPIGKVRGSYQISGALLNVEILEKPLLVSCNRIKEELSKRLI